MLLSRLYLITKITIINIRNLWWNITKTVKVLRNIDDTKARWLIRNIVAGTKVFALKKKDDRLNFVKVIINLIVEPIVSGAGLTFPMIFISAERTLNGASVLLCLSICRGVESPMICRLFQKMLKQNKAHGKLYAQICYHNSHQNFIVSKDGVRIIDSSGKATAERKPVTVWPGNHRVLLSKDYGYYSVIYRTKLAKFIKKLKAKRKPQSNEPNIDLLAESIIAAVSGEIANTGRVKYRLRYWLHFICAVSMHQLLCITLRLSLHFTDHIDEDYL